VTGAANGAGEGGPGRPSRLLTAAAAVLLACLAALTAFTCLLLYRTGRAVQSLTVATDRLSARLDGIGRQVERAGGAAAGTVETVEKLAGRVEELSGRMELAEGWAEALRGGPAKAGEAEEKLIRGLLAAVQLSGLRFVRGGREKSALSMYGWLYAKYQIWKPTVGSADEFIAKVASESLAGAPYQVILKDGSKAPLADWLRARLAELRGAPAPPAEPGAEEK